MRVFKISNCLVIRELIPNSSNGISELILLSEDSFCTIVILSQTSFITALNVYQRIYFKRYLKIPTNSLLTVPDLPDN